MDASVNSAIEKVDKIIALAFAATLISTIVARFINLSLNFGLSRRIIKVMQLVEELDLMLRKFGTNISYRKDISVMVIIWTVKSSSIVFLSFFFPNITISFDFVYTGFTTYIIIEFYIGIIKLLLMMIIKFKEKLMYADEKSQSAMKYQALKITSFILKLIESINTAFGIQVFVTIFVLLLFGIIMAYSFISTSGVSIFPVVRLVTILVYLHYVFLEVSYYGSATYNELNNLYGVLRRIYSKHPNNENLIFLDVNMNAVKYNCGLINFDWEIIKMVISTEALYYVTLSTFQDILSKKW
ncbi:uncharacterized protein [Chironomus tepperi]